MPSACFSLCLNFLLSLKNNGLLFDAVLEKLPIMNGNQISGGTDDSPIPQDLQFPVDGFSRSPEKTGQVFLGQFQFHR